MEAKPRLHAFKLFSVIETVRLALSYFKIDYEQISLKCWQTDGKKGLDDWELKKKNYQFGDLPVLEIDGMTFSKEMPIMRYLFMRQGLYPTNPKQAYQVESLVDYYQELYTDLDEFLDIAEESKSEAKALFNQWLEEKLPNALNILTKRLNSGGGQFLVGNTFSMADICFLNFRYTLLIPYDKKSGENIQIALAPFKTMCKYWEDNRQFIKSRLDTRPVSKF